MKKLLIGLLIFVALDIAIVIFLPKLVPMEKIAAEAGNRVKSLTGRDMGFSGVKFVFWPDLGIELRDVTLGNPAWAKGKNMLSLDKADIALALMPLLERRIEVKRFSLNAPVIHLEIGPDGRRNWDFAAEKTPAPAKQEGQDNAAAGGAKGFDVAFGQFRISKGRLTFDDRQKNVSIGVQDIDMEAALPDMKGALRMEGALTYRKKRVTLALTLEKSADFLEGRASPGHMDLKTEDASAKADGFLSMQDMMLKGTIDAKVVSLSRLLAWLSGGSEQKLPFEKISFSGAAALTGTDIVLKGVALALDEVQAKGNLNVGFAGKPEIFARLTLDKLDLDRFAGDRKETGMSAGEIEKREEGWGATPLDLSGLRAVNADLVLKTGGFTLRGLSAGPGDLTVRLKDGRLYFETSEATLLDGRFSSAMRLDAAAKIPEMAFAFNMAGVQAGQVLTAFAHFKKLSGLADAHVSVTSSGVSQKDMISGLNGNGSVIFRNGVLEGIDLDKIVKWQKSLAASSETSAAETGAGEGRTEFVELGGTFSISNGIVNNADLKMKSLLLQATGQGTVDLPRKYVQYRVVPVLLASSSAEGASGLAIPVDIRGPFSNIKMKPDFAGAVSDIADNPEAARKTLKNIGKEGKALGKEIRKDPAKALQGLFGSGGLFGRPAPAPESAPAPQSEPQPPVAGVP
ncbi:MAG: AsmA family protein [Pseudomonadota bacterium]